jgi:hypothetical protein
MGLRRSACANNRLGNIGAPAHEARRDGRAWGAMEIQSADRPRVHASKWCDSIRLRMPCQAGPPTFEPLTDNRYEEALKRRTGRSGSKAMQGELASMGQ